MMSKGEVLLTAADLLRWREEDKKLEEEIRRLQLKRADVKRKLDAAEVFAEALSPGTLDPDLSSGPLGASRDDGDSIPAKLIENLRQTGDSLTIKQIKQRLIDIGFGERIRAHPNYHYATAYRLTKRGRLLRRGSRYRAPPISSSEEETEAVGASVHQESHT
jgi:hypothetical protein